MRGKHVNGSENYGRTERISGKYCEIRGKDPEFSSKHKQPETEQGHEIRSCPNERFRIRIHRN